MTDFQEMAPDHFSGYPISIGVVLMCVTYLVSKYKGVPNIWK